MSTDPARPAAGRRFHLTFWTIVAVLTALGSGFLIAGVSAPPRITRVQFDPGKVTTSAGQRIVLTMDRPVHPVSAHQIVSTPATAEFRVSTQGRTITLATSAPLDDGTTYTVAMHNIRSSATPASGDIAFELATADAELFRLVHRDNGPDAIVRSTVRNSDERTVAEAPGITGFAVIRDTLVLVTTDATGTSTLHSASLSTPGPRSTLSGPGDGTITSLKSDPSTNRLGFLFTGSPSTGTGTPVTNALYTFDLARGVAVQASPETTGTWSFIGNSRDLLAVRDKQLDRLSDDGQTVAPLAPADRLVSISPHGDRSVVMTEEALHDIDLASATATPLPSCIATLSGAASTGTGAVLVGADGTIATVSDGSCATAGNQLGAVPSGHPPVASASGRLVAIPVEGHTTWLVDGRTGAPIRLLAGTQPQFVR